MGKETIDCCFFGESCFGRPGLIRSGSIPGWARMAHPIMAFSVVEVAKPKIGENAPARVRADVTVNLNLRPEIKMEWENLRKHDVAFLITVRPENPIGESARLQNPSVLVCVFDP